MPLSEHEQRVLDEIESALYAEDPKFASASWGKGFGSPASRVGLQVVGLFAVGLVLLVLGMVLPIKFPGSFPILSLVGFIVMFIAGMRWLWSPGVSSAAVGSPTKPGLFGKARRSQSSGRRKGLGERMEDRFKKRFDQE